MSHVLVPIHRRVGLVVRAHATALAILTVSVALLTVPLAASRPESWFSAIGAMLYLVSIAFPLILVSDLVSRDLSSGMVQLWLQKRVDPTRFYLARFAEASAAWLVLTILMLLATRAAVALSGWPGDAEILLMLPRLLVGSTLVAAIAFACSAWLARGGTIAALAVICTGPLIENDLYIRAALDGPIWTPLRALLFPESALAQISDFAFGRSDTVWVPLARVLGYAAVWIAIAVVGVRRAVDGGGLAGAQRG